MVVNVHADIHTRARRSKEAVHHILFSVASTVCGLHRDSDSADLHAGAPQHAVEKRAERARAAGGRTSEIARFQCYSEERDPPIEHTRAVCSHRDPEAVECDQRRFYRA